MMGEEEEEERRGGRDGGTRVQGCARLKMHTTNHFKRLLCASVPRYSPGALCGWENVLPN